ncbi:MAG TPA: hypothetical protein VMS31_20925 [Pyrinomonadaceae bacterium]|nr:hypothetical protein [Pyrinomonadaceae bacterium]
MRTMVRVRPVTAGVVAVGRAATMAGDALGGDGLRRDLVTATGFNEKIGSSKTTPTKEIDTCSRVRVNLDGDTSNLRL